VEHEGEGFEQLLGLEGGDVGAVALAHIEHPDHGQRLDRLAQRVAGDADTFGQLGLGGEAVAGLQRPVHHHLLDRTDRAVGDSGGHQGLPCVGEQAAHADGTIWDPLGAEPFMERCAARGAHRSPERSPDVRCAQEVQPARGVIRSSTLPAMLRSLAVRKARSASTRSNSWEMSGSGSIDEASSAIASANSVWKRQEPCSSISLFTRALPSISVVPGGRMPTCTTRPPGFTARRQLFNPPAVPEASMAVSIRPSHASGAVRSARRSTSAPICRAWASALSVRSEATMVSAPAWRAAATARLPIGPAPVTRSVLTRRSPARTTAWYETLNGSDRAARRRDMPSGSGTARSASTTRRSVKPPWTCGVCAAEPR